MPELRVSSTRLALQSARTSAQVFLGIFRRNWIPIVCLHLVQAAASQFSGYATDYLRVIGKEDLLYIAGIALFEMMFTMLWSAAWVMTVSQAAESELENAAPPFIFWVIHSVL